MTMAAKNSVDLVYIQLEEDQKTHPAPAAA